MKERTISERSWPRVDVTLTFFSESLAPQEMVAIAQVEPDFATPAFLTQWGARVARPSAMYGLSATGEDTEDTSSVIEQLMWRVSDLRRGFVALGERADVTILSVAFYLTGEHREAPGLTISGPCVRLLVSLGADVQLAVYRNDELQV